jgi:glycosyltransferase involved in cell wall biosynthesis
MRRLRARQTRAWSQNVAEPIPVLTVNRVGFLGGAERVLISCAVGVQARGFRPIIACPAPGALADEASRRGIDVRPSRIDRTKATLSPARWLQLLAALRTGRRQIVQLAQQERVALLHAHHPVGALYALQAARSLHIPLVLHVHEALPLPPLYALLARHVVPYCSRFVCVSEASCALMRHNGVSEHRIQLVYNCVDEGFLAPTRPVAELLGAGPHVGLFGVLERRKGQADFIRAAALIKDRHATAQFWIVGPLSFADNADYLAELRQLVDTIGLADRVHFTGYRADVPDWMAGMDAVVLGSRKGESLPTVLIEACTLGRPVAATEVGGVREIIHDGKTGLVVPPADPAALATAIERLLGPEGAVLAEQARLDVRRRFSPARFADDISAIYRALLPQGRPALEHAA